MEEERTTGAVHSKAAAHRLSGLAWALFFIWIGIALLAGVSLGISLLVVGGITLLAQSARRLFSLHLEPVWMIIGILFVLGGLSNLVSIDLPLLPVLILLAGVVLLISTLAGKRSGDA
jgi:uncharacterized membrane protein (UPF0136 family)